MAAQFVSEFTQELTRPSRVRNGGSILYTGNSQANVLTVSLYRDGEPYTGGGTVSATAIRHDGNTVPMTGYMSGNNVLLPLSANCYLVPGPLAVFVTVTSGDVVTTVLNVVYSVIESETDSVVDPSQEITISVATLVQAINNATASVPPTYTDLLAAVAPTFSPSTPYIKGQYVWHNTTLYRFTAAHAAGTWTGSDVETIPLTTAMANFQRDLVLVQSAQPTSDDNRLWIPNTVTETQVPTYSEFTALTNTVNGISNVFSYITENINDLNADVTDLNTDLDELKSAVNNGFINNPPVSNGSFTVSGTYTTNNKRIRTDFIAVQKGDKIIIDNGSLVHACGAWEGSLSTETNKRNDGSFSNQDETIISAFDGFYIVVFAKQNTTQTISLSDFDGNVYLYSNEIYRNTRDIISLKDLQVNTIEYAVQIDGQKKELINQSTIVDNYYVKASDGTISSNSSFAVTDYVPVVPNAVYRVIGGASGSQVAFYDKDKIFIPSSGIVLNTNENIKTPNGAHYLRWCSSKSKKDSYSLKISDAYYISTSIGLLNGLINAYTFGVNQVVVQAGEYNVITEYTAKFGSDYFDNYTTNYNGLVNGVWDRGLWLDNIKITFNPAAKVICKYNPSGDPNANVRGYFSPFAVGINVEIVGLVLDSENCRYGIHPDFNGSTTDRTFFKMVGCDIKHFKSSWSQAIGAGLGIHSDWVFEDCIFRSDTGKIVVRIHNNSNSSAQSTIVFNNCYVDGTGWIQVNAYSTSPLITKVIASGCSWITPIVIDKETEESANNVELYAFANEQRN